MAMSREAVCNVNRSGITLMGRVKALEEREERVSNVKLIQLTQNQYGQLLPRDCLVRKMTAHF